MRRGPVVVMGVSGAGKSVVGEALARRLGVPYADADDLHSAANRERLAAGHPLDDADREPWLDEVGRWLAGHESGAVMACSALKRGYRDRLRAHAPGTRFVHLTASREVLADRLGARRGHFMPASLLDSQLATMEPLQPDEDGVAVEVAVGVAAPVEAVVAEIVERLADADT